MTMTSPGRDPLTVLPPEIVLRILEFTSTSALASLTTVSKAWHTFIDVIHQEAIYSSESKTTQPPGGARDFSYLTDNTSFSKIFENPASWKDVCKRQTLLARNWADSHPVTRESILQIGNDPVWRFKPDFKRRFFVSTSQAGGLNVTDMDSGRIIWRLPSTLYADDKAVRPFAHLEYQDGMAVFDREGDAVEVWQADLEGAERGEFRRIAILNHDCQTRGFQLSHSTLCVVSSEGQGFVYDMTQRPPKLTTHLEIEHGGVGHLDQSKDAVVYSMGSKGYHVHDKASGAFLGALQPSHCTDKYHIRAPTTGSPAGPSHRAFAFGPPRRDCLTPIKVEKGPLTPPDDPEHVWHRENEWGAGMLHGDLFVGFSRSGRVFVCSDWRKAIHDQVSLAAHSSLLECESDGATFDLGGWLSVRNHRLMFEIQDRIYIVALDDNNKVQEVEHPARASYSLFTSSTSRLTVPVSFMGLYDDAIMTTYATLGWHQPLPNLPGGIPQHQGPTRIIPTKTIRIVSLAPDLSNPSASTSQIDTPDETPEQPSATDGILPDPNQFLPPAHNLMSRQATLLHLLAMLREDADDDDEDEDELGVTITDLNDFQNLHDLHDGLDEEWEDLDDPEGELEEHQHTHEHEGL